MVGFCERTITLRPWRDDPYIPLRNLYNGWLRYKSNGNTYQPTTEGRKMSNTTRSCGSKNAHPTDRQIRKVFNLGKIRINVDLAVNFGEFTGAQRDAALAKGEWNPPIEESRQVAEQRIREGGRPWNHACDVIPRTSRPTASGSIAWRAAKPITKTPSILTTRKPDEREQRINCGARHP